MINNNSSFLLDDEGMEETKMYEPRKYLKNVMVTFRGLMNEKLWK